MSVQHPSRPKITRVGEKRAARFTYSPSLEDPYLPGEERIVSEVAARLGVVAAGVTGSPAN